MEKNKVQISGFEREILNYYPQKQKKRNMIIFLFYIAFLILFMTYVGETHQDLINIEFVSYTPPPPPF